MMLCAPGLAQRITSGALRRAKRAAPPVWLPLVDRATGRPRHDPVTPPGPNGLVTSSGAWVVAVDDDDGW